MCSGYDWASHQANLRHFRELKLLPADSGWNLDDACLRPEPPSFGYIIRDLEQLKAAAIAEGQSPEGRLPERIAIVAMWNLARSDLNHANRCGAAWVVIPTGMAAHGWAFRNDEARVVIYHARFDFFDRHDDAAKLSAVLHSCFVPPKLDHVLQRMRVRALLDRREHEQVLRRELEYRSPNLAEALRCDRPYRRKPKPTPAVSNKRRRKRRR